MYEEGDTMRTKMSNVEMYEALYKRSWGVKFPVFSEKVEPGTRDKQHQDNHIHPHFLPGYCNELFASLSVST